MYIKHSIRQLANVALRGLGVSQIPPRIPFHFIEVTNKCNLNCDFCPRDSLTRGTGFMEFDLFQLIIKKIMETGARYVNLNRFGESLTHPQFPKMVKYAKEHGVPNVGLVTNGQLLVPEIIETVVDAGIDRINISLDTLDKNKYERIRKGAELQKTLDNIDYLIHYRNRMGKEKPIIAIFSVLITDDFEQMQNIFHHYVNKVNYIEFRPIGQYGDKQRLENLPHSTKSKYKIITCIQPWQRLNIFYNGDVNPCCGDVNGELALGNIKDFSIKEIWNGKKINRIRNILTSKALDKLPVCLACDGCNGDWHDQALTQLRKVYHRLDPDIYVRELTASTPVLFRHSTNSPWR
jgi:radical SAM protein with 4Fe4S-binding SPASM domain